MAKLKLIVEITTRDDKTTRYMCNDFPATGSDFITLYKDGFTRESIPTATVQNIKQYFKHGKETKRKV